MRQKKSSGFGCALCDQRLLETPVHDLKRTYIYDIIEYVKNHLFFFLNILNQ
jgi:hypothetical protein